MGFPTTVAKS